MLMGRKRIERSILPHVGDATFEQFVRSNFAVVEVDLER
jgi:23S rRNA maturation mini-RNase III